MPLSIMNDEVALKGGILEIFLPQDRAKGLILLSRYLTVPDMITDPLEEHI
jgi:hypothetical protein